MTHADQLLNVKIIAVVEVLSSAGDWDVKLPKDYVKTVTSFPVGSWNIQNYGIYCQKFIVYNQFSECGKFRARIENRQYAYSEKPPCLSCGMFHVLTTTNPAEKAT